MVFAIMSGVKVTKQTMKAKVVFTVLECSTLYSTEIRTS